MWIFRSSKLHWKKVCGNNVDFSTIEITSKKYSEMRWKLVEIWSSTYLRNTHIESTWIRRGVPVGKLPVQTKTLLPVAGIFLVVIFVFLCDIVVICFCPTYWVIKWFNIFLFLIFWGLRLLSCLKSKKQNGSDSLRSLIGSYLVSTTQVLLSCIFLSEFLGEWLEVWTRGFIEDDVINVSFININSHEHQPVV